MNYQSFAYLYDELMNEAPYDEWLNFLNNKISRFGRPDTRKVLDLACGTGEMTIRLHEQGFEVTGVDLSEDMLAVASQKAMEKGYKIPFFQQDMKELEGIGQFDAAVIFCDSLNYLSSEEDVKYTFQSVCNILNEGGLLLFDVHSPYKMEEVYAGNTFAYDGDEVAYIWNSFPDDDPLSVVHELTFFVFDETTGQYERFEELHKQRTYPVSQYEKWLSDAGFTIQSVEAEFNKSVNDTSERIFFTAKKIK